MGETNSRFLLSIVGEKMARNGRKTAIYKVSVISKQSILIIILMTFQMSLNESISVILRTIHMFSGISFNKVPMSIEIQFRYLLDK